MAVARHYGGVVIVNQAEEYGIVAKTGIPVPVVHRGVESDYQRGGLWHEGKVLLQPIQYLGGQIVLV